MRMGVIIEAAPPGGGADEPEGDGWDMGRAAAAAAAAFLTFLVVAFLVPVFFVVFPEALLGAVFPWEAEEVVEEEALLTEVGLTAAALAAAAAAPVESDFFALGSGLAAGFFGSGPEEPATPFGNSFPLGPPGNRICCIGFWVLGSGFFGGLLGLDESVIFGGAGFAGAPPCLGGAPDFGGADFP